MTNPPPKALNSKQVGIAIKWMSRTQDR